MANINPLRAWRIAQGLSQREAGQKFGVQDAAVTKWEQGRVSSTKALVVHEVTGIPLHILRPDIYPKPKPETHLPEVA